MSAGPKLAACTAAVLMTAGLSGCSASVKVEKTKPSASAATLQTTLAQKLADSGRPTQSVTCTEDLVGEIGKTTKCDVVYEDGTKAKAVLTTKKLDGDTVNFDYDVTALITKEQVADVVKQKMGEQGQPTDTVECVDDVLAKVGNVVECTGISGAQTQAYTATITSIDNGTANFHIETKQ